MAVGEQLCIAAFCGVDAECAATLSRAGRARVVDSQSGDARCAGECCIIEGIVAEGVADADVVIEVGEGGDVGGAGGIVVDDDGEPESEFAEPDGHRCDVDAEDRVGEDLSADRCDGAWVTELLAECGETLEGGDEDAAGAAGRVEDADRVECGEKCLCIACADRLACECGADRLRWCVERVGECVVDECRDECGGCIEGARSAAFGRIHECFEGASEEVGIDGGFGPVAGVFAGGEAVVRECVEEQGREEIVADGGLACAAFCGGAGEESAVEERDVAECACGGRAVASGRIEGAEREWCDEAGPEVSTGGDDLFGVFGEEGPIVVQPAFGFEELEVEQSSDVDECEGASVGGVHACGPRVGDVADVCVERAEEASSDGLSAEQIVPAQAGGGRIRVPGGGECGDRLRIGVEDVLRVAGEDGEPCPGGCAEPCGDGDGAWRGAVEEDDPASSVGESIEVCGEGVKLLAPEGRVGVFDEEECRVGVVCDAGGAEVGVGGKAECGAWACGERVWGVGEAQCAGEGESAGVGGGGREELMCGARREHVATVASLVRSLSIEIMQTSSKARWPEKLSAGARVALVSASGPLRGEEDVARAESHVREFGWEPVRGAHVLGRRGYLAGSDVERLRDLQGALDASDVDAVWCVRGGYGMTRILAELSLDRFALRPKPVIGFSDVTALHCAVWARAGVVSFHGHTARAEMPQMSVASMRAAVTRSAQPCGVWAAADVVRGGRVFGRLAGGNLALLAALCGTPDAMQGAGAIVVLEDVNESAYRVDRMLRQLEQSGVLRGCVGLAVGQFTNVAADENPDAMSVRELIGEVAERLRVPCLSNLPIGHIADQWTVPLGAEAWLDVEARSLEVEGFTRVT